MLLKVENVLSMVFTQKKLGKKYDIDSVDEAMEYFADQLDKLYKKEKTDIVENKLHDYILTEDSFLGQGYDKGEVDNFLYQFMLTVKALKKQKLSNV